MKSIEQQWLSYRSMVLPKNAPLIQLQECRRAFYAGAQALLHLTMNKLDPGDEPTERDLQMMSAIEQELIGFAEAVAIDVK